MTGDRRRILVVDDEPIVRKVLERIFAAKGYAVVSVGDAETALARAEEGFDAILLDNSLPGMMGITALPVLIEKTRAPVVMMTGHPSEETHRDAMLLGAKAFLVKPFDHDALLETVRSLIAS